MKLASRIADIGVSPILATLETERRLRAQGGDIISLSAGEPDFPTSPHVLAAAHAAMKAGDTKYPPLTGTEALKRAIRIKFEMDNDLIFNDSEVIVSTGSKQAIYNAFMATLHPGDEVILPVPYWTSYPEIVRVAQGVPKFVETKPSEKYQLHPERLEAAITPHTRWLLLNSPSNPSGAVYSDATLADIATVLRRHPDILILCDDIYEHIIFDVPFKTLLMVAPDLRERCLIVNGVSKAYAMTGWRLGYAAGPQVLIRAMSVIQSQSTSGACTISQAAALSAIEGSQHELHVASAAYRRLRNLVVSWVEATPGLEVLPPDGAFYALVDCRAVLPAMGLAASDDVGLTDLALRTAGVSFVPGSAFGAPGFIRLSFANSDANIIEALQRLSRLLQSSPAPPTHGL